MYQVTVRVSAKDPQRPNARYKKIKHTGLFIPTSSKSRMTHEQIKKRIEQELRPALEKGNDGLELSMVFTVEKLGTDFCVKE